jgi:hypothetical protein
MGWAGNEEQSSCKPYLELEGDMQLGNGLRPDLQGGHSNFRWMCLYFLSRSLHGHMGPFGSVSRWLCGSMEQM